MTNILDRLVYDVGNKTYSLKQLMHIPTYKSVFKTPILLTVIFSPDGYDQCMEEYHAQTYFDMRTIPLTVAGVPFIVDLKQKELYIIRVR